MSKRLNETVLQRYAKHQVILKKCSASLIIRDQNHDGLTCVRMGIVKVKRGSVGKGAGKGNPGLLAGMSVSPGIKESTTVRFQGLN